MIAEILAANGDLIARVHLAAVIATAAQWAAVAWSAFVWFGGAVEDAVETLARREAS